MPVILTFLAFLAILFTPFIAHAGAVSGEAPTPPSVDFTGLVETADVQSIGADGKPHPVRARLLTDTDQVAPGSTFRLGLHLEQLEGWHTYWKSPGDIGLPTDITWTVPEGATTTPYEYPIPLRFEQPVPDSAPIISRLRWRGFSVHRSHATSRSSQAPSRGGAEANWLVCLTSCIPGSAKLELPIQVAEAKGEPNAFAATFDHYAAQHPVSLLTIEDLAFEGALSNSAVQPNSPFKAAFLLTSTGETPLDAPTGDLLPLANLHPHRGLRLDGHNYRPKSHSSRGYTRRS